MIDRFALPSPSAVLEQYRGTSEGVECNGDALTYLQMVYRDPMQSTHSRMKAASIAIEYERPRLAITATIDTASLAERLDRAIAKSEEAKAIQSAKVIEGSSAEVLEPISAHYGPVPGDRRYRR